MTSFISTEDRLPDENVEVIGYDINGTSADEYSPHSVYFEKGKWFSTYFKSDCKITHWQPMPKDKVQELTEALKMFGSDYPDGKLCFCEMRIGNPMLKDHTDKCKKARNVIYGEEQ